MPRFLRNPGGLRALVPIAALGLAAAGCGLGGEDTEGGPPPASVETTTVRPELLRDIATFNGQLSAENSVLVKAETPGVVSELLFEEGQNVRAGDVLVRLRDDEQRARVSEAEANLQLAEEVNSRTHKLARRDAVSVARQDESAAQLAVARARLELARVALERTYVRAPFDGVLGMRLVSPGDRLENKTALVQIDAVDRLQVAFAISELGILFARVGTPVTINVAPYPNEQFPGEVFFVSPTLDPATRRIIVKAWVPNPGRRLRAGLFANVDMEIQKRENALLVPETAVVFDRQGSYVWRLDAENVPSRVPIEVGLRKHGRVEVTMGLAPGDVIVSAGTHKVSAGHKVAVHRPEATSGQARRETPEEARAGEGT